MAKRGTTGLFYCGKKLDYKCGCCNGYCGPTNGCNCTSCKKLDILHLSPKKGTTGKYYCGRKVLKCRCCNGYCGPTNGCNCKDCQQFQIKQKQQQIKGQKGLVQLFQKIGFFSSQSSIFQPKSQSKPLNLAEDKKFKSQIVKPKKQDQFNEFFEQLSKLNLSQDTLDILENEAINDWQILSAMTKEDFLSLKIKFGDVMRILSVIKK